MSHRSCLAEKEERKERSMGKTEEGKVYVGVDLHKLQMTVCVEQEGTGEILLKGEYKTDAEGYDRLSGELHRIEEETGDAIAIAVEATGNARYFKNRMEREGFEVVVVNTNKFKVITMSTKKTDQHDAATLAYYLSKGMLPESHLCDQTSEEIRRMLKTRSILVSSMVKVKNQIHGMMLGNGIETKAAQLQSKKKRQELIQDLADHGYTQFTAMSLQVTLDIVDGISEQIKAVEKQIREMIEEDETVELLMTVPGIGFINAATIAAYTKDIERFEHDFKRFASYLGIVPGVHNSGDTEHYGRITKRGPQTLRTAFVQVAMGVIRMPKKTGNWDLMADYALMKRNKGNGKAIIALTRKMDRIVFAMLNTREAFDPERMIKERIIKQTA